MSDITSSFNEIKIDGDNNKIYIGSKEKFEPMMEWMGKKIQLEVKGVGKRYAPNNSQYVKINLNIKKIKNYFKYLTYSDTHIISEYLNIFQEDVNFFMSRSDFGIPPCNGNNITSSLQKSINKLKEEMKILNEFVEYYQNIAPEETYLGFNKQSLLDRKLMENEREQSSIMTLIVRIDRIIYSKEINLYKKRILFITGEALIGKTHLFCDITLNRLKNNQPTLLFFGNNFDGNKTIIQNMITQLGLASMNEDEFLQSLNKWGEEYHTPTLIMIDAINETEDSKIWQDGIIKFCEQIKSYPNLALAMSIRDVEKNKIITSDNEEYIANEIVEVEHKGFEGIELEAVRTFCEALEVEFPKVPIHTYRLFVNPGMLFLYIETIKNSSKKVDTSIINPLTIFRSYIADLERKYYQKYMNEVDEEDEVVLEAIEEFISLGTKEDYIHFYLDYKEVKKSLKPLHNKILEFLISEGVLNKLKQESGTKVYFTYQKFENFFIADYLLNDFDSNKDNIFKLIKEYNGAMSEALFMQIPEKLDKDIFDLNVWFIRDDYICKIYLESLVWRNPNTINDTTFKYINFILSYHNLSDTFLDTVLQLSTIPNHPLNIERLHKKLLKFKLSERDYRWSIYIHDSFIGEGIVKRIINWAWDKKEEFEIEDESLYLYGLTLGWFLTSSNRELRDGATKALVNLFTDRVDVFLILLKEFETVDDLYVLERLYAVGYGIVLRSSNKNGFEDLGKYVYKFIFNQDEVIEHIMLRDYAKLMIESISDTISLNVEMNKVLPPYGSRMPNDYPSLEGIEEYGDSSNAFSSIISSMRTLKMGNYGNFGRYIFQSSLMTFKDETFDIQDLSNYAVKVIFDEYVKDIELFDEAEKLMTGISHQRNEHKVERIGKKYQWLAMYKVLAKVSDNYQLRDDSYDNYIDYEGVSRLHKLRNIDPSSILREKIKINNNWWLTTNNDFEDTERTDREWIASKDKLPTIEECINVSDENKDFLLFDTYFEKSGTKDKEEYRSLVYGISAYIVKKDNLEETINWIKKQNFYGNDIAETISIMSIHLREYPNSKAYQAIDNYYNGQMTWNDTYQGRKGVLPHQVLLSSAEYLQERSGYDSSLSDNIRIKLPNKWFITEMGLKQSLNDGEWINENKEIVFFDPSITGILIADKQILLNFLEENGYAILWTLNAEKMITKTDYRHSSHSDFIGFGKISGYGYLDGDSFIEDITINFK